MELQLDEYASVTLDASGNGQVSLAPDSYYMWTVTTISVTTDQGPTETPIPQCRVYRGSVGPGQIVATTWMGNQSTAGGTPLIVQPSQPLIVRWENGVSGSVATVSLDGTMRMR